MKQIFIVILSAIMIILSSGSASAASKSIVLKTDSMPTNVTVVYDRKAIRCLTVRTGYGRDRIVSVRHYGAGWRLGQIVPPTRVKARTQTRCINPRQYRYVYGGTLKVTVTEKVWPFNFTSTKYIRL